MPAFALGAFAATATAEEPLELPTLPGYSRAATRDLNNRGHVVGLATGTGMPGQAVLWRRSLWKPDTVQPLPTLPGMVNSEATAISRSGIPVGFSFLGSGPFRAVVWKKGPGGEWEVADLEPPPGLTDARALGVSSGGEIVGWASNPVESVDRAVLWTPKHGGGYSTVELETPDGFQSRATAINARGDVTGVAYRTEFEDGRSFLRSDIVVWRRPFGRRGGSSRLLVVLAPLPALPTNWDPAISLRGDVVARAEVRIGSVQTTRPVLWKRRHWRKHGPAYGDPIELPVPEGFTDASAMDINAFRSVVGTAFVRQGMVPLSSRAVRWSRRRGGLWTVEELDSTDRLGFVSAVRLNDLGWVAGNEFPPSAGGTGALLWKPSRKPGCRKKH